MDSSSVGHSGFIAFFLAPTPKLHLNRCLTQRALLCEPDPPRLRQRRTSLRRLFRRPPVPREAGGGAGPLSRVPGFGSGQRPGLLLILGGAASGCQPTEGVCAGENLIAVKSLPKELCQERSAMSRFSRKPIFRVLEVDKDPVCFSF